MNDEQQSTTLREAEIFVAWNETGAYEVGTHEKEAIERLREVSDGDLIRVKRYTPRFFLPFVADGGPLDES